MTRFASPMTSGTATTVEPTSTASVQPPANLNKEANPETANLITAVEQALKDAGANGYERDLAAFQTRIDPFVSEALKSNNKLSRGMFNQRLNLMLNRPSYGQLYRYRATVIAAANTHMGTKLPASK